MKLIPSNNLVDSEINLLQELALGNHHAFEKLYRLHWKLVFNEAYSRLKNQDEAENITQDVFATIWENRATLEIQNLKAYLYVVTKNKTLNLILKKKPDLLEDYEDNLQDDSSPLMALLAKEAKETLHRGIHELPQQQRAVYAMRYEEDLSTDEIAKQMGLSVKTVRNHLGKAIANIRSILKFLVLLFF